MHDVIVIGGGISGLTTAYNLRQEGYSVRLLEAAPQVGGNIRTEEMDDFRLEVGPHSFMGSSENVWKLTSALQLEVEAEPAQAASRFRYIYRDGRLHPLPMGPGMFLRTPLLSLGAKLRLGLEPFIPNGARENDTAWEFFCRRFGREAATYIMSPFVSGVYAGDVRMLGARAAFHKFWEFEKNGGSMILGAVKYMRAKRRRLAAEGITPRRGLFSFRGGLGRITAHLGAELGDAVRTGTPVETIIPTAGGFHVRTVADTFAGRSIVLAVPPAAAARILSEALPELQPEFSAIPMAPVAMVHWTPGPGRNGGPPGFGFLMPQHYDLRVLGTIFASQLFSRRAPAGSALYASFYGGMHDPAAMALSDSELTALVTSEHRHIFGDDALRPQVIRIRRYPEAIPQLLPQHPERIAAIEHQVQQLPGLFLAGNYLTGVGIEHATESGYRAAAACSGFLRSPAAEGAR
ncbi:MAG: protoporphyrinogen oxidase [Acidobacteria bacterium]|nr:protoporphyrinogen oxidase [Acidobacteriota bacterium]